MLILFFKMRKKYADEAIVFKPNCDKGVRLEQGVFFSEHYESQKYFNQCNNDLESILLYW